MMYGALPVDLGPVDISPTEMLFWMYCPIKVPGSYRYVLPESLKQFEPIVVEAMVDFDPWRTPRLLKEHYVYLTAKTLWVSEDYVGNRPGWHSDGFGTDDVNYIWCDRAPTEFLSLDPPLPLPVDCADSMATMERWADPEDFAPQDAEGYHVYRHYMTFPDKHLLRLDQSVIHRSPVRFPAGMRTFVKVSISRDRYDLVGNSINHKLPESHWPLVDRKPTRNHPQSRLA